MSSPSSLAGPGPMDSSGAEATTGAADPMSGDGMGGADQGMKMVIQRVRAMENDLLDMAQMFPQAGPEAEQALGAVRSMLRKIIANPGAPEPAAPPIGG